MVLIVLAIIWAAVLIPPLLRSRAETSVNDSMGDFRRHLGVLRRTAPATVAPAYRLNSSAARPNAPATATASSTAGPVNSRGQTSAQRRRQQVLMALAGLAALSLVGALLIQGTIAWAISLLTIGMLVGYIALLARMKTLAQERSVKLRYLPETAVAYDEPAVAYDEPAVSLQRSVN